MRNKNVWIIAAVILVVAVVMIVSQVLPKGNQPAADAPTLEESAAPLTVTASTGETAEVTALVPAEPTATATTAVTAEPTATTSADAAESKADEPAAYLLVTVGAVTYQPVALIKETDYTVSQQEGAMVNHIHVTTDSVMMSSSTCENQDCVNQGVVSLDNKDTRILGGYIICLPNQVQLQLLTPAEYAELMASLT